VEKNSDNSASVPNSPKKPPIGLFDQYGRKLVVQRDEWFEKFIEPSIVKAWNNPDELSTLLANAIEQRYAEELENASQHLLAIDPIPLRGTCIRAAILLLCGKPEKAEKILRKTIQNGEPHPHLLTLLSKALILQKKNAEVLPLITKALSLNPNHDEAIKVLLQVATKEKKESILEKLVQNPKAIKARIELATQALKQKNNDTALTLLKEAANQKEADEEELGRIGQLLNSQNLYLETLQILDEKFQKRKHGITLGSPLTQALLELGQIEEAKSLLEILHKKKSHLWRDELQKLEENLSRANLEHPENLNPETIELERIDIQGPIWLHQDPNAQELFPDKDPESPRIAVLPASVIPIKKEPEPRKEAANTAGRLSRILPLLITEWIEMQTDAQSKTVVPWVKSEGAFALFQEEWNNDDAIEWTQNYEKEHSNDYTIVLNLQETRTHWKLQGRIINTLTAQTEEHFEIALQIDNLVNQLHTLKGLLFKTIQKIGVKARKQPEGYNPPKPNENYLQYAIRLEQCLACLCAAHNQKKPQPLSTLAGERDILHHSLLACLECPESLPLRLTFLKTLSSIKKINENAAREFQKPLQWLQKASPLPPPYNGVLKTKIRSLFQPKP
jgi:thioredoxin-like negative regulator of GroEL